MLFAHIQYPIIDFRYFLKGDFSRAVPVFPAPAPNTWLRNFGHVRDRKTDTSPYYIGENKFCEAHNAVKFEKLPLFKVDIERSYDKVCKFRRFRSDGYLKSCFEIGMEIYPNSLNTPFDIHRELKKLFVNVKSYSKIERIRVPLFDLGNRVCELYEDSTSIEPTPIKTIYSGRPIIVFINYSEYFNFYNSPYIVSYDDFSKFDMGLEHLKSSKDNFWMITLFGHRYNKKILASIRRALLAISLEKETLLLAYNFLLQNSGSGFINEDRVINYISNTQEKLLRQVRFGIPQSPIVDTLIKLDNRHNKSFYFDIINLISKVGDRYVANDFNKLFFKFEFEDWYKKITKIFETTTDNDLRMDLEQFRVICNEEDKKKFWPYIQDLISQGKYEDIIRNVISNGLYDGLVELGKMLVHLF